MSQPPALPPLVQHARRPLPPLPIANLPTDPPGEVMAATVKLLRELDAAADEAWKELSAGRNRRRELHGEDERKLNAAAVEGKTRVKAALPGHDQRLEHLARRLAGLETQMREAAHDLLAADPAEWAPLADQDGAEAERLRAEAVNHLAAAESAASRLASAVARANWARSRGTAPLVANVPPRLQMLTGEARSLVDGMGAPPAEPMAPVLREAPAA
jgi:hypothetical protein